MLRAGRVAWGLLGVAGVAVLFWIVVSRLAVVVIPLVLALFPAAALAPLVGWMVRHRVPRVLAALLALLGLLAVISGLVAAVIPSFVAQLPALADSITRSLRELQPLLSRLPGVPPGANLQDIVQRSVGSGGGGQAVGQAVGITLTALEFLGGLLLLLVALFFYLYEGERMTGASISVLPRRHRATARELATEIWQTLGGFIRAQCGVATVDAVLTGVGLALLGVPLALPLAVLVFLGAFLPYIGAIVTGVLAVLVALASGGPTLALAVIALIVVVQQLDGNVIEPLITGKVLQLPAFVVIVAVTVGATLLGVLGAFLAVPVTASVARAFGFLRERQGEGEHEDHPRQETAVPDGRARQS
ncbi:MAG: AI-2E family transporter [Actinomycetota bacterium]|nr:AI-2E family transporter [Actinomycetota bacterium]